MLKLLNENRAPVGGWRYVDPDSSFRYEKGYRSLEELLEHIRNYRAQNGLKPIPKLRMVVQDWLCHEVSMGRQCCPVQNVVRGLRHYLRGAKIYAQTVLRGQEFVSQEVAEQRAEICVCCPKNVINSHHDSMQEYTDRKIMELVGDKTTSNDDKLFTCEVCTCVLAAKVHFPKSLIAESLTKDEKTILESVTEDRDGAPMKCWQLEK